MKKILLLISIFTLTLITTGCERINYPALQELNTKAKAALDSGDYETAINRLKASLDIDDKIFETHYNLGIAYTQAEKYPEAIATFNDAIKLNPNFPDAYYSLAVAQENYASSISDGSLKKKSDTEGNASKQVNEEDAQEAAQKPKLSSIEKTQITQLYTDSIASYEKYSKLLKSDEEKKNIEEKIGELNKNINEYSSNK